ncbi:MAG TPA: Crp/Fnr family transcriptional regulator [Candidatus Sulfotelmatobacter sp.]|nr:Crp/Fnr family transcriptional regulator [Candidatus Sulfotelmatobacter sp.]
MAQPLKVLPRCDACAEREQCIFGNLPAPQLENFNRIRHFHQYKARQIIFHEGTPALGFHIGCSGRIKLSKADSNGREQIVRIASAGEIIGEEALMDGQPYGATAEPLEDCHTAFIKRGDFLAFLNGGGGIASRFLLHFCRTLIETQGRLARMGLGDARARLAATLLDLTQRYGKPTKGGVNLDLELSRSELAAMVGLSPETAMRLLSEFKADGLLRLDGRQIIILSRDKLAALASL